MSDEPLRSTVIVRNPRGFHLRPVTSFAQLAGKFHSSVLIGREGWEMVNGKSPITMMTSVMVEQGTPLILEIQGPDAPQAMAELLQFINDLEANDPAD